MLQNRVSILLVSILCLALAGSAIAKTENGIENGKPDVVAPAAAFCFVTDTAFGNIVNIISESNTVQENLVWAEYEPNAFVFNVKFVIKYSGNSFVRHKTVHKYEVLTNGDLSTPFSPSFGFSNALQGLALLKVKSEQGTCGFFFTVVP